MKPIKIAVEDNNLFMKISFLLDRKDFLSDIYKARKELKINKLLSRTEADLAYKKRQETAKKQYGIKSKYTIEINFGFDAKLEGKIWDLIKKYKKSFTFFNIIKNAILCNSIADEDFATRIYKGKTSFSFGEQVKNRPCYFQLATPPEVKPLLKNPEVSSSIELDSAEAAIIITPETTIKDVISAYRMIKKRISNIYPNWYSPDTISNIKRDRKWYWLKIAGWSYSKICKNEDENTTRDSVIKAIKQYEKRLAVEI